MSEKKLSVEELDIYTDDSKSPVEQDENMVRCAIFILQNVSHSYKLNPMTSSYMEALAIDKVINLIKSYSWPQVNIYTDSLNLKTLKNSETFLFPRVLNSFNLTIVDLI